MAGSHKVQSPNGSPISVCPLGFFSIHTPQYGRAVPTLASSHAASSPSSAFRSTVDWQSFETDDTLKKYWDPDPLVHGALEALTAPVAAIAAMRVATLA